MTTQKTSNDALSVSALAQQLKHTLEERFGHVRVRGELSKITHPSSGHLYSALKDEGAVLDVVCWKGTVARLKIRPEEGLEVIATGRITTYPARSNYQLVIDTLELAGEGALLKMLEERKRRLAAEGLFDPARKRPLPFLPERIGVITSPTGAVIRDILHRLRDRFPRPVLLWPVLVQGEGAAEQMIAAIKGFDSLPANGPIPRPDLLILARGGGSLEDLMPFNDEGVVRALAACSIPVITAVGHETDTTLVDYVADQRAPTPTAAAEMAVPVRANLYADLQDTGVRMAQIQRRRIEHTLTMLRNIVRIFDAPQRLFETRVQRLDLTSHKLASSFHAFVGQKHQRYLNWAGRVRLNSALLQHAGQTLRNTERNMLRSILNRITHQKSNVESLSRVLESLSFQRVLERGFAVLRTPAGVPVQDPQSLCVGDDIVLEFAAHKTAGARITRGIKKP